MARRVAAYGTVYQPYWSSPEPSDLQLRKRLLADIWGFAPPKPSDPANVVTLAGFLTMQIGIDTRDHFVRGEVELQKFADRCRDSDWRLNELSVIDVQ